jgi:molybdopterin converting factor small subunit
MQPIPYGFAFAKDPERPVGVLVNPAPDVAAGAKAGIRTIRRQEEVERPVLAPIATGDMNAPSGDAARADFAAQANVHRLRTYRIVEHVEQVASVKTIGSTAQVDLRVRQVRQSAAGGRLGGQCIDRLAAGDDLVQEPHPPQDHLARRLQEDARANGADTKSALQQGNGVTGTREQVRRTRARDAEANNADAIGSRHGVSTLTFMARLKASRYHTRMGAPADNAKSGAGNAVTVEFFGVPRQRAGRAELIVLADTVADLLDAVEHACPSLRGLRRDDGRLSAHYLLSLDGAAFLSDLKHPLHAGDRVLLLSADAGG